MSTAEDKGWFWLPKLEEGGERQIINAANDGEIAHRGMKNCVRSDAPVKGPVASPAAAVLLPVVAVVVGCSVIAVGILFATSMSEQAVATAAGTVTPASGAVDHHYHYHHQSTADIPTLI